MVRMSVLGLTKLRMNGSKLLYIRKDITAYAGETTEK